MRFFILIFISITVNTANLFAAETRIVSLNPALTEILFSLNLEKEIVGTSAFSNYPEAAKKLPNVGSYLKPSLEKIIELKPTHILVFKEGDSSVKQELEENHFNTIIFDDLTLAGFSTIVEKLGQTFDRKKEATQLIQKWNAQIDQLSKSHFKGKTFMIQVDHNPIFVAGTNTFLSDIFEKCGMKNVFSNLDGFKRISEESVMNKKPDFIFVLGQLHEQMDFQTIKQHWKTNPATQKSIVINGPADTLSRLGPRLPGAALQICVPGGLK